MKVFNSVELFTGAGGLALGLESSGWHHIALVERNEDACKTILANKSCGNSFARNWELYPHDVKSIKYSDLKVTVDLVAGGPPCQPFSLGGKHKAYNDSRDMFPEAVRAVRELKPRFFVFENVKGLLRQSFSTYFNYIILQLSYPDIQKNNNENWIDHLSRLEKIHTSGRETDLSYRVIYRLLNAAEYGVPQNRHRVFIVGFRSDLGMEWNFPKATHSYNRLLWDQWVTGEYWDEHKVSSKQMPTISTKLKEKINRLKAMYKFNPPSLKRFRTVRDAIQNLPDPHIRASDVLNHEFREGARPYPGHTGSSYDEPSKTLKAGDHGVPGGENMIVLPSGECRYYTVRESARIQTFPDDYYFYGSWTEAMRQIGNAVPMMLAETVGKSIFQQAI